MGRALRSNGVLPALLAFAATCAYAQTPSPQQPLATQSPARDRGAARTQGTATMRGRVIDAATGQPLYRTRVSLARSGEPPLSALTAFTGDDGRFELRGVPAAAYAVSASRSGYLPIRFGQRQPGELGQSVTLRDGETLDNIDIAMFKGGVLAGRVLDEENEPAPGVRVEALALKYVRGARSPVQVGFSLTNDLGEFRIPNLEPGAYYLNALTNETWGDLDATKSKYSYAPTFYPGVLSVERAQTISLAVAQEAANLDFQLVVGRAVRIAGVVRTVDGDAVAGQPVILSAVTPSVLRAGAPTIRTGPDGAFQLDDVAPGEYRLTPGNIPNQFVSVEPLIVQDADLLGMVVPLHRAGNLAGSVVIEDGLAPPFVPASLRVLPVIQGTASRAPLRPAAVAANWAFMLVNYDGGYLFRLEGLPDNWILKSARLNGRDITDSEFVIPRGQNTTGLQLVVSPKAARVEGTLANAAGASESGATVVIFSDDESLWGYGSRFVKAVRPDASGRFVIGGLPWGAYLVAAREYVADGQWESPDYLRGLRDGAAKLDLREEATGSVKLTLAQEPGR